MVAPGEQRDVGKSHQPYCPITGHSWRCNCQVCNAFWQTSYGIRISQGVLDYYAWKATQRG